MGDQLVPQRISYWAEKEGQSVIWERSRNQLYSNWTRRTPRSPPGPGPGLGGHCIPIDPYYLSWKTRQTGMEARFIELAGAINGQMPHFVAEKIQNALNDRSKPLRGARVLVMGVAY